MAGSIAAGKGPRRISAEEEALFEQAMQGVRRLAPAPAAKKRPLVRTSARADHATPAPVSPPPAMPSRPSPKAVGESGTTLADLDKRTAQRFRRGAMPIDATLDLHHMTQAQAHAVLHRFLAQAAAGGKRCLLIITGKGGAPKGRTDDGEREVGVLRRSLPLWLEQERGRVLAFHAAQPKHGGGGAFYVLLRRKR